MCPLETDYEDSFGRVVNKKQGNSMPIKFINMLIIFALFSDQIKYDPVSPVYKC